MAGTPRKSLLFVAADMEDYPLLVDPSERIKAENGEPVWCCVYMPFKNIFALFVSLYRSALARSIVRSD